MKKNKLIFILLFSFAVVFSGCSPIMNNILKPNEKEIDNELPDGVSAVDQGSIGSVYWCYGSDSCLYFFGAGNINESEAPWSKYDVKQLSFADKIENIGTINGVTNLDKILLGRKNTLSSEFFEGKIIKEFDVGNSQYNYSYPLLKKYDTYVYCDRNYETEVLELSSCNSIAAHAFKNCTKIKVIYIPKKVTKIEKCAFENFTNEQYIQIDSIAKPSLWNSLWDEGCNATILWNYTPYGPRPPLDTEYKYQEGTFSETLKFFADSTYEYCTNDTDSDNKYLCNVRKGTYKTTDYGYELVSIQSIKNDYGNKGWKSNIYPSGVEIHQPVYKNGDYIYIDGYVIDKYYGMKEFLSPTYSGSYSYSYSYCVTDTDSHDVVGVGVKQYILDLVKDSNSNGTSKEEYSLIYDFTSEDYNLKNDSRTYTGTFRETNDLFWISWDSNSSADPYYESKGVLVNGASKHYFNNTQVETPSAFVDFLYISDTSIFIKIGNTKTITATPYPLALTPTPPVTFSSSDESIAIVSESGVITGISEGNAKITAKCEDFTRICTVKIY